MRRRIIGLLVVLLGLSACDVRSLIERMAPKEDVALAHQCLQLMQHRDVDGVMAMLDPSLQNASARDTVANKIVPLVPQDPPLSEEIIGVTFTERQSGRSDQLIFEYRFPKTWLLMTIVIRQAGQQTVVQTLNVQLMARSLKEQNAPLVLAGKSASKVLFAALALLIPAFTLTTAGFALAWRGKWWKRCLWAVAALIGITSLTLDWNTGQTSFAAIMITLLGGGFRMGGTYGGWAFSISFPLGALLFWLKRITGSMAGNDPQAVDGADIEDLKQRF